MNLIFKHIANQYVCLTRRFIPLRLQANDRDLRDAENAVTLAFLAALSVPLFALLYHFLNFDKAAAIVLSGGAAMLCSPLILKSTGRIAFAREFFICSFYGTKLWLAYYLGGIESPTLPWLLLCPMVAMVLGGVRPGAVWGIIITITVSGVFYLQTSEAVPFPPVVVSDQLLLQLVSILGLFIFSAILLLFFKPGGSPGFTHLKNADRDWKTASTVGE